MMHSQLMLIGFVTAVALGACDSTEPPPPVTQVVVTVDSTTLALAKAGTATAVLRSGAMVITGRPITWTSSNPAIVEVVGTGTSVTFTAHSYGNATITATSEGVNGQAEVAVVNRYSMLVRADNPIAYWRFEETAGTVATDSSAHARHGAYLGNPVLGNPFSAVLQRGLTLQNEIDGMRVTGAWTNLSAMSAEAWVRPTQVTSSAGVIMVDKGSTWNLMLDPTGRPGFQFPGNVPPTTVGPTPLVAGQTYHLVGTYANGTMRLYVNGVQVSERTGLGPVDNRDEPIHVGRGLGSPFDFFGAIDEVAIYDRELPAAAILAHYNAAR